MYSSFDFAISLPTPPGKPVTEDTTQFEETPDAPQAPAILRITARTTFATCKTIKQPCLWDKQCTCFRVVKTGGSCFSILRTNFPIGRLRLIRNSTNAVQGSPCAGWHHVIQKLPLFAAISIERPQFPPSDRTHFDLNTRALISIL
jgi:hypothetical protein